MYAEGWQSWSYTRPRTLREGPWYPRSPNAPVMATQHGKPPPAGVFAGSGLLALVAAPGAPVEVFGASEASRSVPRVDLRVEGEGSTVIAVVSSDGPVEHVSDDGPGGLAGALARFGDRFVRAARGDARPPRAVPPVWCSWYQYWDRVTEEDIVSNVAAMDRLGLDVGIVQVDDGWQPAAGDWGTSSTRFGDLARLAQVVLGSGRRPGIWLAPFVAGRHSRVVHEHPDWVVRDGDDQPLFAGHAIGDDLVAMDATNPAMAENLSDALSRLRAMGFDYFKLDFLYAAALSGKRRLEMSDVEAYRHAVDVATRAIGKEAIVLGCGAPLLASVGLFDAMRIGPDTAPAWLPQHGGEEGELSEPCQMGATDTSTARAWQQGRFWANDADCLIVRPTVQRREEWARTVQKFSSLRASSDNLDLLDTWGVAVTRDLLVPSTAEPFVPSGAS